VEKEGTARRPIATRSTSPIAKLKALYQRGKKRYLGIQEEKTREPGAYPPARPDDQSGDRNDPKENITEKNSTKTILGDRGGPYFIRIFGRALRMAPSGRGFTTVGRKN